MEQYMRERCPGCGTFAEDWQDPETKRPLDEPRWMPVVRRCGLCADMQATRGDIPEGEKGIYVGLGPWTDDVHPAGDDDTDSWSVR